MPDPTLHYQKSFVFGIGGVCGVAADPEEMTFNADKVTCARCLAWLSRRTAESREVASVARLRLQRKHGEHA